MAACSSAAGGDGGTTSTSDDALTGCHGKASTSIPSSGEFYLTTFGGAGDGQHMACGESTRRGSWYYAASRQRFGCGAHIQIEANGKCVVAETDDYGPDQCVENRAGRPIIDASPMVAKHLFGVSGSGWSDRLAITVTQVDDATPLGPCSATPTPPDPTPPGPTPPDPTPPTPPTPPNDGNGGDPGSSSSSSSGGGGQSCTNDGDCNPGNDGSGLICDDQSGTCVPGCRSNIYCPGIQTCHNGQCQ